MASSITPDIKIEQQQGYAEATDVAIMMYRAGGFPKREYQPASTEDSVVDEKPEYWPVPLPYAKSLGLSGLPRTSGDLDPSGFWAWDTWEYIKEDLVGPLVRYYPSASGFRAHTNDDFNKRGWPVHLVPFEQRRELEAANQLAQSRLPRYTWENITYSGYSYPERYLTYNNSYLEIYDYSTSIRVADDDWEEIEEGDNILPSGFVDWYRIKDKIYPNYLVLEEEIPSIASSGFRDNFNSGVADIDTRPGWDDDPNLAGEWNIDNQKAEMDGTDPAGAWHDTPINAPGLALRMVYKYNAIDSSGADPSGFYIRARNEVPEYDSTTGYELHLLGDSLNLVCLEPGGGAIAEDLLGEGVGITPDEDHAIEWDVYDVDSSGVGMIVRYDGMKIYHDVIRDPMLLCFNGSGGYVGFWGEAEAVRYVDDFEAVILSPYHDVVSDAIAIGEQLLLFDGFDYPDGALPDPPWNILTAGAMAVDQRQLSIGANPAAAEHRTATPTGDIKGEKISFDCDITGVPAGGNVTIIARYADVNNYYQLEAVMDVGSCTLSLERRKGGAPTSLASFNHTAYFSTIDGHIDFYITDLDDVVILHVFLDGELVLSATDDDPLVYAPDLTYRFSCNPLGLDIYLDNFQVVLNPNQLVIAEGFNYTDGNLPDPPWSTDTDNFQVLGRMLYMVAGGAPKTDTIVHDAPTPAGEYYKREIDFTFLRDWSDGANGLNVRLTDGANMIYELAFQSGVPDINLQLIDADYNVLAETTLDTIDASGQDFRWTMTDTKNDNEVEHEVYIDDELIFSYIDSEGVQYAADQQLEIYGSLGPGTDYTFIDDTYLRIFSRPNVEVEDMIRVESSVPDSGFEVFSVQDIVNDGKKWLIGLSDDYGGGYVTGLQVDRRIPVPSGDPWLDDVENYPGVSTELCPYVYPSGQVYAWRINALRQCFELLEMHVHRIEGLYSDIQGFTDIDRSYLVTRCKWKKKHSYSTRSTHVCWLEKVTKTGVTGGEMEERRIDMDFDYADALREPMIRAINMTHLVDDLYYTPDEIEAMSADDINYLFEGRRAVCAPDGETSGFEFIRRQQVGAAGNTGAGVSVFTVGVGETLEEAIEAYNAMHPLPLWLEIDESELPFIMIGRTDQTSYFDWTTRTEKLWSDQNAFFTEFSRGLNQDEEVLTITAGDQACGLPNLTKWPSTDWSGSEEVAIDYLPPITVRRLMSGIDPVATKHINELRNALEAFEQHTHEVELKLLLTGQEGDTPQLLTIRVETGPPEFELGYGKPSEYYKETDADGEIQSRLNGESLILGSHINSITAGVMWLYKHMHRMTFDYGDIVKNMPDV